MKRYDKVYLHEDTTMGYLHEDEKDLDGLHQFHHWLEAWEHMLHIVCFACLKIYWETLSTMQRIN